MVCGRSLFMVTNDGIARCLDVVSGRVEWKERLKGEYRASPLAADGRIYFLNTKGLTTVMGALSRISRLTENQLTTPPSPRRWSPTATFSSGDAKRYICVGK